LTYCLLGHACLLCDGLQAVPGLLGFSQGLQVFAACLPALLRRFSDGL
jgi:hypothetical protein